MRLFFFFGGGETRKKGEEIKRTQVERRFQHVTSSSRSVVCGIGLSRGSWFYHCLSKVVFDERFYLSCELSQSIAPATQNEVPCPMILHAFIFNPFLGKSGICFSWSFFVCVVSMMLLMIGVGVGGWGGVGMDDDVRC